MALLKKLIFAPFFLVAFAITITQLITITKSYDFIFAASLNTLIGLLVISGLIALSGLLFILFATFANNWKFILPIAITAAFVPMLFIEPALGLIFAVAIFVSFLLTYLSLDVSLKSYLSFQPSNLLGPSIRQVSGLLILSFCIIYFFSASKLIAQKGFELPDSLIDTALEMTPVNVPQAPSNPSIQVPNISQEQIELLKGNPELLKQYGLDPTPVQLGTDLIKQTVQNQVQDFIKPYLQFIPAISAILLFLTLQSLVSIIHFLVSPLLWLIFLILEKTGFTKFTTEMRPVKKLVV